MHMNSEIQKIETAIAHYFDGLYDGDTEKLARVFNTKASLFIEDEGHLTTLPVPEWFERVASRPSPASRNAKRDDRILMIDRVGEMNAIVKISCMVDPTTYTDYLSLIKFEGRWQIVAKAYCKTN
jgi:hypothetical protein